MADIPGGKSNGLPAAKSGTGTPSNGVAGNVYRMTITPDGTKQIAQPREHVHLASERGILHNLVGTALLIPTGA